MNIKKAVFRTSLLAALSLVILGSYALAQSAALVRLQGFKTQGDKKYQFSDITSIREGDGIFFLIEPQSDGRLIFVYDHDQKSSQLLSGDVKAGQKIRVPTDGKNIYLKGEGKHVFTARLSGGGFSSLNVVLDNQLPKAPNKDALRTVMKDAKTKKESVAKDSRFGAALSGLKNDPFLNTSKTSKINQQKSVKAPSSLRSGEGARIFNAYADAVVMVATDQAIGSGVVLNEQGFILTNYHVVNGATNIVVVFKPSNFENIENAEKYVARVIKVDEGKDLALLDITIAGPVKSLVLANPTDIKVGEEVHAIGHPEGLYWSYTQGVISQIRKNYEWAGDGRKKHRADIIQTQTPINPGNSGGPLISETGKLIGLNSFVMPNSPGLNFAVSTSSIQDFLQSPVQYTKAAVIPLFAGLTAGKADLNKDGYNETTLIDSDNTTIPESIFMDTNGDGKDDIAYSDDNENGMPEISIELVADRFLIYYLDDNEDGTTDRIGYDIDGDNEVDRWEAR